MKVSKKAAELVGSEIIKLAGQINARKAQGELIYNLTIGDFNPEIFPVPEMLQSGVIQSYQDGETNYPPANGLEELRESVSAFLERREGLYYPKDEILIAGGARPLIFAAYQAIVDPGDKVIYPLPSWNNNHYTHLSDGEKVPIETTPENNFMPTAEDLAPSIQGATLVAVCSPLNPTGTTFTEEQLASICDLIIEENKRRGEDEKPLYLLYDQIYWCLTYGETRHVDPVRLRPEMRDYTIYIDGISKAFAATGVRVGWAFGPPQVIGKMKSILGHVGAWAPRAEQVATADFLYDDKALDGFLTPFKEQLFERLQGFYQGFKAMEEKGLSVTAIAPQAAIYLTVKFELRGMKTPEGKVLETNRDVHQYILDAGKLAIVPFYAFGASEESPWYRLSVGTARVEEIPSILKGVEKAVAALTK